MRVNGGGRRVSIYTSVFLPHGLASFYTFFVVHGIRRQRLLRGRTYQHIAYRFFRDLLLLVDRFLIFRDSCHPVIRLHFGHFIRSSASIGCLGYDTFPT